MAQAMQLASNRLAGFVKFLPTGHFIAESSGRYSKFGCRFGLVSAKAFDSRQDDHAFEIVEWQCEEFRG